MIILDTNVLSALMRPTPDQAVLDWMDTQVAGELWVTSVTVLEIRFGLAQLAAGRRRQALQSAFDAVLREDLGGRILAFDAAAAGRAAELAARRRRAGRPVDLRDTQIAGIALARSAAVATRDLRSFEDFVVPVVNPWA